MSKTKTVVLGCQYFRQFKGHQPGEEIELPEKEADTLIEQGKAEEKKSSASPSPSSEGGSGDPKEGKAKTTAARGRAARRTGGGKSAEADPKGSAGAGAQTPPGTPNNPPDANTQTQNGGGQDLNNLTDVD